MCLDHVNRQQFLDPDESVLMISMVKKLQKLTSKKVQLILTNKPKLIYVDPSKLIVKGNIIWSDNPNDLSIQVTSPSHFKICTVSSCCFILHHHPGDIFCLFSVQIFFSPHNSSTTKHCNDWLLLQNLSQNENINDFAFTSVAFNLSSVSDSNLMQ